MRQRILPSVILTSSFILNSLFVFPQQANAQACTPIVASPDLYQIDQSGSDAVLYFTPVNTQTTGYTIIYGLSEGDERYSTQFAWGESSGAVTYTIGGLTAGTTYYFKVRANNACSQGPYSAWKASVDDGSSAAGGVDSASDSATPVPTLRTNGGMQPPVTGPIETMLLMLASFGLLGVGFYLIFGSQRKTLS